MRIRPRTLALAMLSGFALGCPEEADEGGDAKTGGATESSGTSMAPETGSETGSASATETGAETQGEQTTGVVDGETLYSTLCAVCHGEMGEGTDLGYELQHPVRDYSTWVVRNGRPGEEFEGSVMLGYGLDAVSDEQLGEIWDFLDSFDQPADGEGLYLDYCGNCHGEDGTGGVVGKDISDKGFDDTVEKVRDGISLDTLGARMMYMPAYDETRVSDEELQAITEYVTML